MKKLKWFILSIFLLAVIAGAVVYMQVTQSPQYSLKMALSAIQAHDAATFEKYVNIDKLLDRAVGDWIDVELKRDVAAGKMSKESATMAIGFTAMVKGPIISTLKKEIISQIETLPNQTAPADTMQEENTNTNISSAKELLAHSYRGIKYVKKEGALATVGLAFYIPNNEELVVELLMKQQTGYWQVIAIQNLTEIVEKESDKTAQENTPYTENN